MSLYRSVKIGSLELQGNLFLAPVAGYTDRAFRSLCADYGACFSFTELASAESIYRNPHRYGLGEASGAEGIIPSAVNLIKKGDSEAHYAIQLFGSSPETIYKAAVLLAPFKPSVLDINSGCPVPKIVKNGAGSALMKDPANLGKVVEAAVKASRESLGEIPVTIKIRSGWDSTSINYVECARIAVEAGAAMVTLHARTRCQGYSGKADWLHIADLASRLPVPVTGSGDLFTPEDAQQMLQDTGCAAIMFARGVMGNPFIFTATKALLETGAWESATFAERIAAAIRHLEMLAADIGERAACLEMRKQFCAYTKGLSGGAALREKAVQAKTVADFRDLTRLIKS